ncbi:asparagine synthase (glutamine-hydrolyzing) [Methanoplanus limicola]|uniref:Putative asparagine synthetase [glutamine-hydrolyzing] n=1 Tax=Methanoplanus limicola DSM 2279 TaxID=937775 RepID=H1Z160_9EURY|nr:asparagine synthase (glutamine-hydrolyzing) [Methanoplanus limicola]EHQ35327.1 asparagine synthase (glutamine-hydrolyzing) [Methanoplanus limicola DSM 2279]
MCGIAGHYNLSGENINKNQLMLMSETLSHRGPDDSGIFIENEIGLAHRRLSIIDLSDEGRQPMTNEDETLWMTFNGEIYNFQEIRTELIEKGHIFRSRTDSEVIIHSYEEWGPECLLRFNGMWAFSIWDKNKKELFCARDRYGIKPLYYTVKNNNFIFASEIKALCCCPDVGKKPNDRQVINFLKWGLSDHTNETMFEGVLQLPAGHFMKIHMNSQPEITKYYSPGKSNDIISNDKTDKKDAEKLFELLKDSTRLHLRSDVPTGTCLSGGLDSSTITVLINKILKENNPDAPKQKTFSAVFNEKKFDESDYIKIVVNSTDVNAHYISPNPKDLWNDLDHLIYSNDEPFMQLTLYSQYCIMRYLSKNVKVVLDGQGADEIFAGYIAYLYSHISSLIHNRYYLKACKELAGMLKYHSGFLKYALKQFFVRKDRRDLINGYEEPLVRYQGNLNEALLTDLTSANLPYLLHWEDRMSMAFSVEARVPFLDYRIIEYVNKLPADKKIRNGITKYILRKSVKGIIPEEIRCRMDKKGFSTPEEVWMKEELKENILEVMRSDSFASRKYWNSEMVCSDYCDFIDGKKEYSSEIWRIVCTELWLRKFFPANRIT